MRKRAEYSHIHIPCLPTLTILSTVSGGNRAQGQQSEKIHKNIHTSCRERIGGGELGVGNGEEVSFETELDDRERPESLSSCGRELQSLEVALEKVLSLKTTDVGHGAEKRPVEVDLRGRGGWKG